MQSNYRLSNGKDRDYAQSLASLSLSDHIDRLEPYSDSFAPFNRGVYGSPDTKSPYAADGHYICKAQGSQSLSLPPPTYGGALSHGGHHPTTSVASSSSTGGYKYRSVPGPVSHRGSHTRWNPIPVTPRSTPSHGEISTPESRICTQQGTQIMTGADAHSNMAVAGGGETSKKLGTRAWLANHATLGVLQKDSIMSSKSPESNDLHSSGIKTSTQQIRFNSTQAPDYHAHSLRRRAPQIQRARKRMKRALRHLLGLNEFNVAPAVQQADTTIPDTQAPETITPGSLAWNDDLSLEGFSFTDLCLRRDSGYRSNSTTSQEQSRSFYSSDPLKAIKRDYQSSYDPMAAHELDLMFIAAPMPTQSVMSETLPERWTMHRNLTQPDQESHNDHINEDVTKIVQSEVHQVDTQNLQAAGDESSYLVGFTHKDYESTDGLSSRMSETSTPESSSFWLAEYSEEGEEKLDDSHPFLEFKALAIARVFEAFSSFEGADFELDIPCDGADKSSPSSAQDCGNGKASASGKRTWAERSEASRDTADGSAPSSNQTAPSKRRRASGRQLTFACPYTKKDPMAYKDCYKYTLSRIRDVKQHLARCHRIPPYCPRCMGTFRTEEERDGHIREGSCSLRPSIGLDGITEFQRLQLSKKSASNTSLEAQWFAVFDILFPGHDPRPLSPYIDTELLQDITLYQDFLTTNGPRILSETLTHSGSITWNLPNEERDLAAFQQTVFEEGLRVVFDQWLSRRSSRGQNLTVSSSPGSNEQYTPQSCISSREGIFSTSADNSGVVIPALVASLPSEGPADETDDREDFQEASLNRFSFGEGMDDLLNFETGLVDLHTGSIYEGLDDELVRLMTDARGSSPFQPGLG